MKSIESFFQDRNLNYGWVMVVVVFVLSGLAFGSMASISVFLKPVSLEFGWSRGQTSFAYTVASFASAAFGVIWGQVADKYGTKWFGYIGAICMSLVLFALSSLDSIIQFYLLYFLFGAMGSALLFSPLYANVGFWFRENPGLALGLAASGGAIGQAFIPHLSGILIENSGWKSAYIDLAIIYILIALPISFLIQESPWRISARTNTAEEDTDFPLSEKEVVAWISCAVIFCCVCMSIPIMHLVPLLTDKGFSMEFCNIRINAIDVLRRIWSNFWRHVRRLYWCSARLYFDVLGSNSFCCMVSSSTFSFCHLLNRGIIWFYLFWRYVEHSGLYQDYGFCKVWS